jgi:hypothetical protein
VRVLRLRQLVLATSDLDREVTRLQQLLEVTGEPYRDPGVGAFGLVNAVLTAGTDVVEVLAPRDAGSAVGRWLERRGADGGYMLMVDGPPGLLDRDRLAVLGARVVHDVVLPDITDVHLHPKDVGGVLLALDTVDPPGSWRWAGPDWTGTAPAARGGLRSVTIAVDEPTQVATRWAQLLDRPTTPGTTELALDDGQHLLFVPTGGRPAGAVAATFALPVPSPRSAVVAGVALDVEPLDRGATSLDPMPPAPMEETA